MRPISLIVIVAVILGIGWYFNVGNIQGMAVADVHQGQTDYSPQPSFCNIGDCKSYEICDDSNTECVLMKGRCESGEDCRSGECTDFHYCTCTSNADCESNEGFNCDPAKGYCRQSSARPA